MKTIYPILLCLAVGFSGNVHARLVAILVVDTDAKDIASDMSTNLYDLSASLEKNLPVDQLTLTKIGDRGGPRFSARAIKKAISNANVTADDAILFYYSGHGYYETGIGSFFLPIADSKRRLLFRDIAKQLAQKRPRLIVSILDSCSVIPGGVNGAPGHGEIKRPHKISPAFRSLFFEPRGRFHINSSSPGEYAICRTAERMDGQVVITHGSLFTSIWIGLLSEQANKPLSWQDVYSTTKRRVDKAFRDTYNDGVITLGSGRKIQQRSQTVWGFDNGRPLK